MLKIFTVIPLFFLALGQAHAGTSEYQCQVLGEYTVDQMGQISGDRKKLYLNSQFKISRKNGNMSGVIGNNLYRRKQVIDAGGPLQSFKVLSISKEISSSTNSKNVLFLNVEEFAQSDNKPFFMVNGDSILSGVCH